MKKIQIPFDLSKIDKDTKIETRDGYEVEILRTNLRGNFPILGIIKKPNYETDTINKWTVKGYYYISNEPSNLDLFIVEEVSTWWDTHKNDRFEQYLINGYGEAENHYITLSNARFPSTPELALRHYAFTQISYILQYDKYYGGFVTNDEWNNDIILKYCIVNRKNHIEIRKHFVDKHFLAFHSEEQAEKFVEEYPELVKQYLCIEDDIKL